MGLSGKRVCFPHLLVIVLRPTHLGLPVRSHLIGELILDALQAAQVPPNVLPGPPTLASGIALITLCGACLSPARFLFSGGEAGQDLVSFTTVSLCVRNITGTQQILVEYITSH